MKSEQIKVLLIEDNPGDAKLILEMNKDLGMERFDITHIDSLSQGIEKLHQKDFGMVLLDLSLPDSSGLDTVKLMLEKAPNLPIIILTGTDDEFLALEAVKYGAEDYLVKGSVDSILLKRSIYYAVERFHNKKVLKDSENKIRELLNRANFYKDLFTHDMNNILQNILTSTELCNEYIENPKEAKITQKILAITRDQIFRGAQLVNNVRKLSQLEEVKMEPYPMDLNPVLERSINLLKQNFKNYDIMIRVDSLIDAKLNANAFLNDIFDNLLINTVSHNTHDKVEIEIKFSKIQRNGLKYIQIEIIDNGVGIEDIWKETIFKRGINEVKSLSGMGLGLSLVKKIIDSYNGQIYIKDRVFGDYTQGSNFIIEIPEVV